MACGGLKFTPLGAALLVPNSLALLNITFPEPERRARAIGVWAAVASIGALSGPLPGGFLVNAFGWRSIFLINVPTGIVCFAVVGCFSFLIVKTQTSYLLLACIIAVLGFGLALVLPSMTEAVISHAPRAQSGLAAGMLNVSRQVGGVLGVAILGTLVGNLLTFLSGMHIAFVIAGGTLILALLAAWLFVRTRREIPRMEALEMEMPEI